MAQKTLLLDMVVAVTGYARKYAIGLLSQASEGKGSNQKPGLQKKRETPIVKGNENLCQQAHNFATSDNVVHGHSW